MNSFYTDRVFSNPELLHFFLQLFPALTFFEDDMSSGSMPDGFDPENRDHLLFQPLSEEDQAEFGFAVTIFRLPAEDSETLTRYIAQRFAEFFSVRTLVTFSHPDRPHDPFYDLVFDSGKIFLADDLETVFARDGKGMVKYLREYNPAQAAFDSGGRKISN